MNASSIIDHGSAGNSSSASTSHRINGTYGSNMHFTTYNHARSSTVVSPENGKFIEKRFSTFVSSDQIPKNCFESII